MGVATRPPGRVCPSGSILGRVAEVTIEMSERLHTVLAVFRAAFANPVLRRVGLAYALFGTAEFGLWLVLLVYAYGHGGPTASMVMALVQLIPCIVLAPFIGSFADRRRPSRVLSSGYGIQAATLTAVAVAVVTHAPTAVVYGLAPLTALGFTVTRPAQAALLPAIVRTPDELTAANVMTGWTEGASSLAGPALAGALMAWHGPGLAVSATAVMSGASLLLVATVVGPAAAVAGPDGGPDPAVGAGAIGSGVRSNVCAALGNPELRVLLILHAFYFVLIGSLDLLCVILAVSILHLGPGGAGYLNAALGGGALLAGLVTAFLVGRPHLSTTLLYSLLVAVAALALLGAFPGVAAAFVLIATVGLAGAVFDITGRTLLQRAAPPEAIAGSFSILEALTDLGLALGTVLVRLAIGVGGLRAALFAPAVVAVLLIVGLWRHLRRIDAAATVPQVEIQLLRSIPIFAALAPPSLEGVARELVPLEVTAGTVVIAEGDRGDRYYAVADGRLTVTRRGREVGALVRGEGFGEIVLVRDVPRQASVTAVTDAYLFALDKTSFVQTITGHAAVASAVHHVVADHLAGHASESPATADGGGTDGGLEPESR